MTRLSACLMILLVSITVRAQQRDTRAIPPPTAPAAPTGKGSAAGTVIADASGSPIAYASVVLIGARTGALKVTSTDRQGVFSFAALPDDRYTIGVSKLPYSVRSPARGDLRGPVPQWWWPPARR